MDENWDASGYDNISFEEGTLSITIETIDAFKDIKQITSTSVYQGISKSIVVKFAPSKFSKFAYYSASEPAGIWWTGYDTVWGPFHVQGDFRCLSHPVFHGKVTHQGSMVYNSSEAADAPVLLGGYESGV